MYARNITIDELLLDSLYSPNHQAEPVNLFIHGQQSRSMVPANDVEETAREFATRFVDGSFAAAADLLTEDGRAAVVESFPDEFREGPMDVEEALEQYWWGLYGQYGSSEGVEEVNVDGIEATVEFSFEDGTEMASVDLDEDAVADVSFAPEYEAPDYADESAFSERNVTVDAGDVDLDGILAVPDGAGPFPAVVLVHGAGIHDSDGTAGASKILKDLAWGFASEGIASLRYENRLGEHEVDDENYTLDTVVTDDAVAAVDELAATDEVSKDAVFVAGHSLGGMCAPRIGGRHVGVAGVVNLDGPANPTLNPDDLGFMRFEFEPDGDLNEDQEAELERERETVRRLAEGDYDDDETIWGRPGTWHRSVGTYDPVGTARGLDIPVFVLKTGRADVEIQTELVAWLHDEYEKWRAVDLADGSRVEFYEHGDHYFQEGFAPANPLSLYFGGNVADGVVAHLVEWIQDVTPSLQKGN